MPSATAPKTKTDGREVKRLSRQQRYKLPAQAVPDEDFTPDFMNIVGMVFSLCGIMLKFKGCAWMALYCSCASFANYGVHDNAKQIFTSFIILLSKTVQPQSSEMNRDYIAKALLGFSVFFMFHEFIYFVFALSWYRKYEFKKENESKKREQSDDKK